PPTSRQRNEGKRNRRHSLAQAICSTKYRQQQTPPPTQAVTLTALSGCNEPLEYCSVRPAVTNACQLRAGDHLDHLIHFRGRVWLLAHEAMPTFAVHREQTWRCDPRH